MVCFFLLQITKVVLNKGWRCLECTVCEACGKATDPGRLLLCDDCDISYHTYCLDPPLQTVPKGGWKCKWCVGCGFFLLGCSLAPVCQAWSFSMCPSGGTQKCNWAAAARALESGVRMWELLRKRDVKSLGAGGGYGVGILSMRNHCQQVYTSQNFSWPKQRTDTVGHVI